MANLSICVVDDDVKFLEMAKEWDVGENNIEYYSSPVAALKAIGDNPPDILISDVMMPGMHGLDFCVIAEKILNHKNYIVISANTSQQIKSDIGIEPKDYFKKPLREDFFDHLDSMIERVEKEKESNASYSSIDGSPEEIQIKMELYDNFVKVYSDYQNKYFEKISKASVGLDLSPSFDLVRKVMNRVPNAHNFFKDLSRFSTWDQKLSHVTEFDKEFSSVCDQPMDLNFTWVSIPVPPSERLPTKKCEIIEENGLFYLLFDGKTKVSVLTDSWLDPIHMDKEKERVLSRYLCVWFFQNTITSEMHPGNRTQIVCLDEIGYTYERVFNNVRTAIGRPKVQRIQSMTELKDSEPPDYLICTLNSYLEEKIKIKRMQGMKMILVAPKEKENSNEVLLVKDSLFDEVLSPEEVASFASKI